MKYLFVLLLFLASCQKDCIEPQIVGVIEMTPNPDDPDRLIFKHLGYRQYGRDFNEREERRRGTERGQTLLIGISLLSAKALADAKLDWK